MEQLAERIYEIAQSHDFAHAWSDEAKAALPDLQKALSEIQRLGDEAMRILNGFMDEHGCDDEFFFDALSAVRS